MWFFGILLLMMSAGLAWGYRSQQRKLGLVASTQVVTVGHLRELATSMSEGLGPGSLHFIAAVQGKARCEEPLVSDLSETPSVHYSMHVRRELEVERESSQGSKRKEASSQQLAHERKSVSFLLEDATGSIRVDPASATITAEKKLSRFEPAVATGPQALSVGRFERNLPSLDREDSRTKGYQFEEEVIATGADVFVLGEVTDSDGELKLADPQGDGEFLISVKNRKQILDEAGSQSKIMRGAAMVTGILGVILLIL